MILADKKQGSVARVIQQADAERQASSFGYLIVLPKNEEKNTLLFGEMDASSSSCLSTVYLTLAQTDMNVLSSTLHNWQQFNM